MRWAELLVMSVAAATSASVMVRRRALKARSTASPFSSDWLKRRLWLSSGAASSAVPVGAVVGSMAPKYS